MAAKERHRNKPDPSQPWRYVCPDCGGQVNGYDRHEKYQCGNCDAYWRVTELRDQKNE